MKVLAAMIAVGALAAYGGDPLIGRADAQATTANTDDADDSSDAYARAISTAVAAFEAGHFEQARTGFNAAHALQPSARTWRGIGLASYSLRDFTGARRAFERALIDPRRPLAEAQRTEVEGLLRDTAQRTGRFELHVQPTDVRVEVDGVVTSERELVLATGDHTLTVSAPGHATHQQMLRVVGSEVSTIAIALTPNTAPPRTEPAPTAPTVVATPHATAATVAPTPRVAATPAAPTQRRQGPSEATQTTADHSAVEPSIVPWIVLSTAPVFAATAGVVWWSGLAKHDDIERQCAIDRCTRDEANRRVDAGHLSRYALWTNLLLGASLVSAVTGMTLLLVSGPSPQTETLTLRAGPTDCTSTDTSDAPTTTMVTMRKSDPLFASTLRTPLRQGNKARATLPTLTILAHPDITRVGQRTALKGLLAGNVVEVSRIAPTFSAPGQHEGMPLADPHLSRTPFRLYGESAGEVSVEDNGAGIVVDGMPLTGMRHIGREELALGVVIELARSVVLLLHACTHRPLSDVPSMIGQSDAIEDTRRDLLQVADLDVPVLLRGETGTGKELAAALIHARSPRAKQPYVAVNMATVPEATAVSTLFGHSRGAFTGALQRHRGLFEQASGGSLLLDEIGETPENVQPMLLRAIETGRVLPLGEEQERHVNIRFIAATDADLERDLANQSFSAALLHRLSGYEVHLPPLRTRREDIALLLRHFLRQELGSISHQHDASALLSAMVQSGFFTQLIRHALPGNVRQLRNIARHMVISNRTLDVASVTPAVERQLRHTDGRTEAPPSSQPITLTPPPLPKTTLRPPDIDDDTLLRALRDNRWSPNRTAASLGIPTGTLHDLMRKSPHVRRAADLSDADLQNAMEACHSDVIAMAEHLCVSERALRITLRQRGLIAD